MKRVVNIIGAGLAGCEAAWQLVSRGINVRIYEMRPESMTPAHKTEFFAELVCSNSLRADNLSNAVGLLKEEMRIQDSLIMQAAEKFKLPAGGALAVDRDLFSQYITKIISEHPLIEVVREEVTCVDTDDIWVVASGPLSSNALAEHLAELIDESHLHFFDAAAPILTKDSINFNSAFWGSRYDKGGKDYINCPLNQEQYEAFWNELCNAEVQPMHEFEDVNVFEGCMPIEVMAQRGIQTLLFGPLKPVGLIDKHGQQPYAVVQLRQDNLDGTLYNMVGFQTRLKWPEQRRVFSMIPGLEDADFVRYGVMHRNSFINAPQVLLSTGQLKNKHNIFIAGQLSGVEGYVESAASGLICGVNAARLVNNMTPLVWPKETAHGALMNYITSAPKSSFQPMNITFGLLPALDKRIKSKKERKLAQSRRALDSLQDFINSEKTD